MAFDVSGVGKSGAATTTSVPAPRSRAYAAATNDPLPEHLEGTFLPPVLTYPLVQGASDAMGFVVPDGDFGGPALHGEHDFVIHRPIAPDEPVTTVSTVLGLHGKGSGTAIVVGYATDDAAGKRVLDQVLTVFVAGVSSPESGGEAAPSHAIPAGVRDTDPVAVITQHVDDDQTWRFAGPSGDYNPIHVDDAAARAANLPGIINHGMSTLAMASHGLIRQVAGSDPSRLARLAVRFSSFVIPGQDLTTTVWRGSSDGTFHFETLDAKGAVVMKDGLVEVRR